MSYHYFQCTVGFAARQVEFPPATRANFLAMIEQEPQVLQCFRVTGSYNFIVKVSCTDIDALEHLLTKMQKLGSTNTQIILNTQLDRNLALE